MQTIDKNPFKISEHMICSPPVIKAVPEFQKNTIIFNFKKRRKKKRDEEKEKIRERKNFMCLLHF